MNKSMEYIYRIYKEGSFSRAARGLYVSQPALSAMVRRTELQLGTALFDRTKKPVALTEAGKFYISCVERILEVESEMNQYFEKVKSGNTGILSIGSGTYYCTYFLPDLIRNFRALYPGVQMVLSEGSSKQTYQMLLDGKLDFTLDVNENDDPSLDHVVIARENMILAIPESFSCNDKLRDCRCSFDDILRGVHLGESVPPVDMSCLHDEPFILTKPGNHSRDLMLALCRKSGFEPKSVLDMDQLLTAYYVACEGMGITIVRDTSLRHVAHSSKLCFYRLPPELSVRNIYLSFQKKRAGHPLIHIFMEYALAQGHSSAE